MSERRDGLRVVVINTKAHCPNAHIAVSVAQALRADSRVGEVVLCRYDTVVARAQHGCDLLLALDGEAAVPEILHRAAAVAPRSALWSWEDPYETAAIRRLAPLFDHLFTNDVGSIGAHERATFLPLAGSSLFDKRQVRPDEHCDYDVSFVGSPWPSRTRLIRAVMKRRPDLRYKFALSHNPYVPNGYLDLPEFDYSQGPSHFEFVEIANRSRVVLSIHRDFVGAGENVAASNPGPRVFEVALAGGFQVIDRREADVDAFFGPSEVATYASVDECVREIDRALSDPEERVRRAWAAQARARIEHTYESRTRALLDEVLPRVPRRRPARTHDRPRVLFVMHNTLAAGDTSDAAAYQEQAAAALAEGYDVYLYYFENSGSGHRRYVLANADWHYLRENVTPDFEAPVTLWTGATDAGFASILVDFAIDLVHFQDLSEHTVSLPLTAHALGVPCLLTLHDHGLVCHRSDLLDQDGRYCRIGSRPKSETLRRLPPPGGGAPPRIAGLSPGLDAGCAERFGHGGRRRGGAA